MRLVAYDPYVTPDRARKMGVELLSLEELVAERRLPHIHLPKTPETIGLIGKELLARAKPGIRIVNAARGGIVDEEALSDAIASGRVAGAALDVFVERADAPRRPSSSWTRSSSPRISAPARQRRRTRPASRSPSRSCSRCAGDFVPYAVNVDAAGASETVRPFLGLAERLGRLFASLCDGVPAHLDVEYQGDLAG